ncbi:MULTISPECIES: TIGR01777 family oxidoreductase [Serratia]|uniref:Epimerase family protein SA0724 n=1 Tax=Serratia quinivorans TaxID=137545 RepID=A0A380AFW2_9GAMM|nr:MULTISPECIES: TIGR01777 family oxidoreductase [Serratia]QBX69065.1 TIGR01777 family protein [Serratia quinivorans]RYM64596.1 TIGR01777 family protein [Serratia proteamaculans]CAI1540384.1 Epimerase family protein SA0724 [Serratia quinivorans]SUI80149.1 Epimerase family protein SA0724 [Serratia quinivorans]
MRVLITGATGLIGSSLTQRLLGLSHQITVLSRNVQRARERFGEQVSYWSTLQDKPSLDDFDAVINLAGEPIADKRWSKAQKERLCHSRWDLTEQLVKLINASSTPPGVLISGSATGYYGDQGQAVVTEDEAPHDEFTHQLCQRWESLALQAQSDATRVCLLRTGVVLAAKGGALAKMLPPFRLGLGGPIGDGRQYLPWIHLEDMVDGIVYLLDHQTLQGPFNMVAPYPVHNEQFAAQLANVLDRPAFLRVPTFAMRLLMGEAAVLVLGGQRAVPKRLEEAGFSFRFLELEQALDDVINQRGAAR